MSTKQKTVLSLERMESLLSITHKLLGENSVIADKKLSFELCIDDNFDDGATFTFNEDYIIIINGTSRSINLVDIKTGEISKTFETNMISTMDSVEVSPDGKHIVYVHDNNLLLISYFPKTI